MLRGAFQFQNETLGMCHIGRKMKLPELYSPPVPLSTLVSNDTSQSKYFLANAQIQFMFPNDIVRCDKYHARDITHQYSKCIGKFIIVQNHYHYFCHCQTLITNFFIFISWEISIDQRFRLNAGTKTLNCHCITNFIWSTQWIGLIVQN